MENDIDQLIRLRVKKLSLNIREIRTNKGYKQDYMAAKLLISQNAYSKMELGRSSLTIARLFQIGQILEMDIFDIINYQSPAITNTLHLSDKVA
ncbi:helix-turn-helix transcriptional regulator [Mucilaginibacter sp. CAU 1740]|uniref:helix-turn-helix domain-containing protein n=1 Tax=Mucilaginibacter sp. CAU 1740 TaxID=3140365 RepID=UPI00325B77E9